MRLAAFSVLLLIFLPNLTIAQSTHWQLDAQQYNVGEQDTKRLVGLFTSHDLKGSSFGVWSYAGVSSGWGEVLFGPSVHTTTGATDINGGIGFGVEQPDFTIRYAAYGVVSNTRLNLFGFVEHGKTTGFWYLVSVMYSPPDSGPISLGLYGQRYIGIGPKFQLGAGPIAIWSAPTYNPEAQDVKIGGVVGFRVSF